MPGTVHLELHSVCAVSVVCGARLPHAAACDKQLISLRQSGLCAAGRMFGGRKQHASLTSCFTLQGDGRQYNERWHAEFQELAGGAAELHVHVLPARCTAVAEAVLRVEKQRRRLADDHATERLTAQAAPARHPCQASASLLHPCAELTRLLTSTHFPQSGGLGLSSYRGWLRTPDKNPLKRSPWS